MFYEKVNTFVSEDTPEEETPEVPAEGVEEETESEEM